MQKKIITKPTISASFVLQTETVSGLKFQFAFLLTLKSESRIKCGGK